MNRPPSDRRPRREPPRPASRPDFRGGGWRDTPAQPGESSGLFRVYGRRAVTELLRLGLVKTLEVARQAHGRALEDILRLAADQRVPVSRVEFLEDEDGPVEQGVRALAVPPPLRHDLRRFVEVLPEAPAPLILMLDGITDPHNFGAILRTAECAGVSAVIIRERRQAPITDTVVKTSAGAAYLVPVFQVVNLSQGLRILAECGFWSVAAVADDSSRSYRDYKWNGKTVLIVGAEGAGVSELLKRDADERILIPMAGKLESLNVSVATGVILFHAAAAREHR
jgi:23S rRNA (guanosine2251-2'-O)-methyltransferase